MVVVALCQSVLLKREWNGMLSDGAKARVAQAPELRSRKFRVAYGIGIALLTSSVSYVKAVRHGNQ